MSMNERDYWTIGGFLTLLLIGFGLSLGILMQHVNQTQDRLSELPENRKEMIVISKVDTYPFHDGIYYNLAYPSQSTQEFCSVKESGTLPIPLPGIDCWFKPSPSLWMHYWIHWPSPNVCEQVYVPNEGCSLERSILSTIQDSTDYKVCLAFTLIFGISAGVILLIWTIICICQCRNPVTDTNESRRINIQTRTIHNLHRQRRRAPSPRSKRKKNKNNKKNEENIFVLSRVPTEIKIQEQEQKQKHSQEQEQEQEQKQKQKHSQEQEQEHIQISIEPPQLQSIVISSPQPASNNLCVVCLQNEFNMFIEPCGHVSLCERCSNMVRARPHPQCPTCRGPILNIKKCYLQPS